MTQPLFYHIYGWLGTFFILMKEKTTRKLLNITTVSWNNFIGFPPLYSAKVHAENFIFDI